MILLKIEEHKNTQAEHGRYNRPVGRSGNSKLRKAADAKNESVGKWDIQRDSKSVRDHHYSGLANARKVRCNTRFE